MRRYEKFGSYGVAVQTVEAATWQVQFVEEWAGTNAKDITVSIFGLGLHEGCNTNLLAECI
jgi:hypothetical protein